MKLSGKIKRYGDKRERERERVGEKKKEYSIKVELLASRVITREVAVGHGTYGAS